MIYIVEVKNDEQIIGNYKLDKGSLDFYLRLENRIPFDYIDFNKYQSCYVKINETDYSYNRDLPVKNFRASSFEAYIVENEKRESIYMSLAITIKEAL